MHDRARSTPTHYLAVTLFVFLLFCAAADRASAQIPRLISYQGVVDGIADGAHAVTLTLYADEAGVIVLHRQTSSETFIDGLFATEIGPIPDTVTFNRRYWLGVAIDDDGEFAPLTPLASSPYALNALRADRAARATQADTAAFAREISSEAGGFVRSINGASGVLQIRGAGGTRVSVLGDMITITSDTGGSGGGSTNAWRLDGNSGTTPGSDFLGTVDNKAFEIWVDRNGASGSSTVGRGRVMRYEPADLSPNILGGFRGNTRANNTAGVTIAGGGTYGQPNAAGANYATIAGGKGNTATGELSAIGGGVNNRALASTTTIAGGFNNLAEEQFASVGGGTGNSARGINSTIGGGKDNRAMSTDATVGGGKANAATGDGAVIAGGVANRVFGTLGTIGGGEGNATSDEYPTVGGGRYNNASGDGSTVAGGVSDTASGPYSTVGGGLANDASQFYATIAGGEGNIASGRSAAVGGGTLNAATGDYSVVPGGYGMTVSGDRSFGFLAGSPAINKKMNLVDDNAALFGNADLYVGNNDGIARALKLYEPNSETGNFPGLNTHYSSFQAGAQVASFEYVLPTAAGTVGQVLRIAAISGRRVTLEWATPASAGTSIATDEPTIDALMRQAEELRRMQEDLLRKIEALRAGPADAR